MNESAPSFLPIKLTNDLILVDVHHIPIFSISISSTGETKTILEHTCTFKYRGKMRSEFSIFTHKNQLVLPTKYGPQNGFNKITFERLKEILYDFLSFFG